MERSEVNRNARGISDDWSGSSNGRYIKDDNNEEIRDGLGRSSAVRC
jgi:hypothetical protein